MARAFRCDRCNQYYDFYDGEMFIRKMPGFANTMTKDPFNGMILSRHNIEDDIQYQKPYHLCRNCESELFRWLKMELPAEKEKEPYISLDEIVMEFMDKYDYKRIDIFDYKKGPKSFTARIETKAGPVYIYDYITKRIELVTEEP